MEFGAHKISGSCPGHQRSNVAGFADEIALVRYRERTWVRNLPITWKIEQLNWILASAVQ